MIYWGFVMGIFSKPKQTIGFKYFATIHMVLCLGCIDSIKRIRVLEKELLDSPIYNGLNSVNKENLFGGVSKQGGIVGNIDVMDGNPMQSMPASIKSLINGRYGIDTVPDFRGVSSIFLRGFVNSTIDSPSGIPGFSKKSNLISLVNGSDKRGMYLGSSSYPPTWDILTQRINKKSDGKQMWNNSKARIPTPTVSSTQARSGFEFELRDTKPGGYGQYAVGRYDPVSNKYIYKREDGSESEGLGVTMSSPMTEYIGEGNTGIVTLIIKNYRTSSSNYFSLPVTVRVPSPKEDKIYGITIPESLNIGSKYIDSLGFTAVDSSIQLGSSKSYEFNGSLIEGDELSTDAGQINVSFGLPENNNDLYDMNPAHIIYECLTDTSFGLGEPESMLNLRSFEDAADYFYDNGMGLSLVYTREGPIEDFISEVMRHVDAFLYVEPTTGLYTLKIVADDYDIDSLPVIDKSKVIGVSNLKRTSFSELLNQITVTYTNIEHNSKATLSAQDIALLAMNGGEIKSKSITYQGFTNAKNAGRAANRDLMRFSVPNFSLELTLVKSIGMTLRQGSVFKLNLPKYGIENLVMRVTEIEFGNASSNEITVSCMEDIFALPGKSSISEDDQVIPDFIEDAIVENARSIEMPYFEMVNRLGSLESNSAILSNAFNGVFLSMVARPNDSATEAVAFVGKINDTNPERSEGFDFSPFGYLVPTAGPGIEDTNLILRDPSDFTDISLPVLASIGNEFVLVTSVSNAVDESTEEEVVIITVERGMLDTQIINHSSDISEKILFVWGNGLSYFSEVDYDYNPVKAILSAETLRDVADKNLGVSTTVTMVQRAKRPYPPQNVRINGEYWIGEVVGDNMRVEWSHRNKLTQSNSTEYNWYSPDVAPENGTSYEVSLYDGSNLVFTETTENNFIDILIDTVEVSQNMSLVVKSIVNGLECLQPFTWRFSKRNGVARAINLRYTI